MSKKILIFVFLNVSIMGKLDKESIINTSIKTLTIKEFASRWSRTVSVQTIYRAINEGKLDYIDFSGKKLIVLTRKTLSYKPKYYVYKAKSN